MMARGSATSVSCAIVLRWSAREDVPLFQHCEDFACTGPGVLHACACVHEAGLPGIPSAGEVSAVQRDVRMARDAAARFHVCHLSTAGALAEVRRAREAGAPISAEVSPHHLLLTAEDALAGGTNFKMKPPLRDPSDVAALVDGLADGTISAVATDHAPHSAARKAQGWHKAPFGIVGLETAFPLLYTRLVRQDRLRLTRLVESLTTGPAAIAGRPAPRLTRGGEGPWLQLIDLGEAINVRTERFRSKSRNSPFVGWSLAGWPLLAITGTGTHDHQEGASERYRTRRVS